MLHAWSYLIIMIQGKINVSLISREDIISLPHMNSFDFIASSIVGIEIASKVYFAREQQILFETQQIF